MCIKNGEHIGFDSHVEVLTFKISNSKKYIKNPKSTEITKIKMIKKNHPVQVINSIMNFPRQIAIMDK